MVLRLNLVILKVSWYIVSSNQSICEMRDISGSGSSDIVMKIFGLYSDNLETEYSVDIYQLYVSLKFSPRMTASMNFVFCFSGGELQAVCVVKPNFVC